MGFVNSGPRMLAVGVSSVEFGYLVGHFGSYNAPLIPMVLALRGNALVANRGSDKRAIRQRARRRSSVFEIANSLPLRSRMVIGNWAVTGTTFPNCVAIRALVIKHVTDESYWFRSGFYCQAGGPGLFPSMLRPRRFWPGFMQRRMTRKD